MSIIKEFIEVARNLGKPTSTHQEAVDVGYGSMLASLRGQVRTYAIYRALDCCVAKYGQVPENPTAEGRNEADENLKEFKDSPSYFHLAQSCAILSALDDEFGIWDKDEGLEGSLDYQINVAQTPKMSRERARKLNTTRTYDEMIATKEQLVRFQPDILSLLADGIQNQMNPSEMENAPTDADWLIRMLGQATKSQKKSMVGKEIRGYITERQHDKALQILGAYIWLNENDIPELIE